MTAVGFQRRHIPTLSALKPKLEEQAPIHQATVSFLKGGRNLSEPAGIYGGVIDNLTCGFSSSFQEGTDPTAQS